MPPNIPPVHNSGTELREKIILSINIGIYVRLFGMGSVTGEKDKVFKT
jgi:hypothetical protein